MEILCLTTHEWNCFCPTRKIWCVRAFFSIQKFCIYYTAICSITWMKFRKVHPYFTNYSRVWGSRIANSTFKNRCSLCYKTNRSNEIINVHIIAQSSILIIAYINGRFNIIAITLAFYRWFQCNIWIFDGFLGSNIGPINRYFTWNSLFSAVSFNIISIMLWFVCMC